MAVTGLEQDQFLVTTVDQFVRWAQKSSIWPLTFGLACCAIEMMALVTPRYDMARFGAEVFRASPRQADLMIVSGRLSNKMVPVIKQIYQQMPEPKWVVAMGACASSGGIFDNYAIVQGVDQVIPVDVYVPGCPPTPDAVMDAVLKLQKGIIEGRVKGGVMAG
ncbi:NADH-quinone oxidoreductase subunit B [Caldinitratiruptor microaerophilus]|uniref:NADH-quinone oxidoreductase subunit B n=1 Tax=Caldinitratiruptor microaerophilus TaxID=671077 RepID=A0AA35G8N6_9FIRM|nr:NADH-quinone oxidoreductase subunit B [Caldinitratiruptor microaerophilus]BDG59449.1 NADH-quinone oxidoreductase subunit B 1 [Caldinitratiruptor microaerophilus]